MKEEEGAKRGAQSAKPEAESSKLKAERSKPEAENTELKAADPEGIPGEDVYTAQSPGSEGRRGIQSQETDKTVFRTGASTHVFMFLCSMLCIAFGAWAWFGKLDIVSMADGKVVPSSKVKSIQHLEGGIVREILVREGDSVTSGQPLMILEETASGSEVDEVRVRIHTLQADVARLRAAAGETQKPEFPQELLQHNPDLVRQTRDLYDAQIRKRDSERTGKTEIIQQRTQDISVLETRIRSSIESLELLDKQVEISKSLLADNLTTEYKHLSFLREATALRSKIDEDKAALRKARSALKEAQEELEKIDHTFRETHREKLKESRRELDQLLERVKKFSDSFQRTTIRSPVDGIVKTLYVVTREGVVKPGMTVMDIVPASDRLVVESRLPVRDIGYVQPGQKAMVKLASRDAFRFGNLEGTVVHVSPDAYLTEQGPSFYTVRIETERDYFEKDNLQYKLYPGVQVLTYIHTGWRTVFEYLMDPFLNTLSDSFTER